MSQAGRDTAAPIVPATGLSSWLQVLASAAMVFLCTLALAVAFAALRISADWSGQIAGAITVRIDAPADRMEALTEQSLRVLRTTPGVAAAQVVPEGETRALLAPWIENPALLETFDLPQLIDVTPQGALDTQSLALRLEGEVPGATLDDHAAWLAPINGAAKRAASLGFGVGLVAILGLITLMLIASQAAMLSHRGIVKTLRLLGAEDRFIARAFVWGLARRAMVGAVVGIVLAAAVLLLLARGQNVQPALMPVSFEGWEWLAPVFLVPLTGLLAYLATHVAARMILRRME